MKKNLVTYLRYAARSLSNSFKHNSLAVGEDLRKLGLGLMGAGWISFFIPAEDTKTVLLILAGLILWIGGVFLSAPQQKESK